MTMDLTDMIARFGVSDRSSLAVRHNGTGYFAVTPKVPYDGGLTITEQAEQLFEKLDARLIEVGSSRNHMLLTAIILSDMADYEAFNVAWIKWLEGTPPPTRGCFAATLAKPGLKVELIVICATNA